MSLRKFWSDKKKLADGAFKLATAKANTKSVLAEGKVIGNPLVFKEDLGPTLDKYEAAKTPADKKKYGDAAKKVIKSYRDQVTKHEKTLNEADKIIVPLLQKALDWVEGEIK